MRVLILSLTLVCSSTVAEAVTYDVGGDVHGLAFIGTVQTTTVDELIYSRQYVPSYCNDEEYAPVTISLTQVEKLPGQVGTVTYNLPAWIRFPSEDTGELCMSFVNAILEFEKTGDVYNQTSTDAGKTIENAYMKLIED